MSKTGRTQNNHREFVWGGSTWDLKFDNEIPGLYNREFSMGPLLGLEGLKAPGRSAPGALAGASLVAHELRGQTLIATYAPLGWGAIWVQARWTLLSEDTVDLMVEVQARTVGELIGLEVMILSALGELPTDGGHRSVDPRDPRSASLSYDGRETDLSALVTGPPVGALGPWCVPKSRREGWTYAEFSHTNDVSRRILEGKLPFQVARHALFGHDIEKGIVLRARLQAAWLPKPTAMSEIEKKFDRFRSEPLPLSI